MVLVIDLIHLNLKADLPMIKHLRIKLTLWFLFIVMVAYTLDGLASIWTMTNRLNESTENALINMFEEIVPAVNYKDGKPTLADWMHVAARRHITAQTTIQLFGADENLLESYGPRGIERLRQGVGQCIL